MQWAHSNPCRSNFVGREDDWEVDAWILLARLLQNLPYWIQFFMNWTVPLLEYKNLDKNVSHHFATENFIYINYTEDNDCTKNDAFNPPFSPYVPPTCQWQNLHSWKQFPQPPILYSVLGQLITTRERYILSTWNCRHLDFETFGVIQI